MDALKKDLKKIVCTVCLTAVLSFILFFSIKVDFVQYLGIFVPLILFFMIKYFHKENIYFGGFVSVIALVNLSVFLFKKYQENYWLSFDLTDFLFIAYALFNIIMLCYFFISLFLNCIRPENFDDDKKNFSERNFEFNRIKDMISKYNIVGINAQWGDGKTFLFKRLERDLKNEYRFLTIKVLSVTVDSVENFILNEINYLLEKESIFSITSSKIKDLLNQPILHNVGKVFLSASSFTNSFEQIKQDVRKIGKPLVITFEDVDRIEDKEILFKIFSIVDMLACDNIKFAYQYEENKLLDILEEDKQYLEKYIPYVTSLAPIPFDKCIRFFCDEKKYPNLKEDDFLFFAHPISVFVSDRILNRLCIDANEKLEIPVFSIRKIQIFLDEVNSAIKNEAFKSLNKPKQSVIMFYYIKHFCYFLYQKIDLSCDFFDIKFFNLGNDMYSLKELFKSMPIFENVWINPNNKTAMKVLFFLGYNFKPILDSLEKKEDKRRKKNIDDFFVNICEREDNEKINRMIRNLYAAGKSEYTNYELFVKEMDESVLRESDQLRKKKFYKLYSKMLYSNNMERDNRTIFRFAIPQMYDVFQAFNIYENKPDNWIKLIDLYFQIKEITAITPDLLEILNRCVISYKKVYLFILNKFNNLSVVGHLKDEKCYLKFLDKYLSAISMLRYIDTREVEWIDAAPNEWDIIKENVLIELIKKLSFFSSESPIESIKDEVRLIMAFVEKNIEIINFPKRFEDSSKKSNDIINKTNYYDKHIRELEEKKLSLEEIKDELEFGYKNDVYNPNEVNDIWDYFVKKNQKKD